MALRVSQVAHISRNSSVRSSAPTACFYTGRVLGDPVSTVAVSLCRGMVSVTQHLNTKYICFLFGMEQVEFGLSEVRELRDFKKICAAFFFAIKAFYALGTRVSISREISMQVTYDTGILEARSWLREKLETRVTSYLRLHLNCTYSRCVVLF